MATSNFKSLKNFPLLVFYTYDEVQDMMDNCKDCPDIDDFENEDEYFVALEKFQDDYMSELDAVILTDEDIDELRERLDDFNAETYDTANRLYDVDNEDDYYSLKDIEVDLKDGYYEAAQLDVENEDEFDNLSSKVREEQLKRFNDFFKQLKDEFGLTAIRKVAQASNGETFYKKDESLEKETNKTELTESKITPKGEQIAKLFADYFNEHGGVGPFGGEDVKINENEITLTSQGPDEIYEFYNDGSVEFINVDELAEDMVKEGEIEEDEVDDYITEFEYFDSVKDLLHSGLSFFNDLENESEILNKVDEILKQDVDEEDTYRVYKVCYKRTLPSNIFVNSNEEGCMYVMAEDKGYADKYVRNKISNSYVTNVEEVDVDDIPDNERIADGVNG